MRRLVLAWLACISPMQTLGSEPRPFTVRASIELPRIVDFTGFQANRFGAAALYSPDRAYVLVGIEQGDVTRNQVCDSLLVFVTADVERFLADRSTSLPPSPQLLTRRCSATDFDRISMLRWVSAREVGFIAGGDNGVSQVFVANVETRQTQQVTRSETHVASFDVAGDRVVFMARSPLQTPLALNISERPLYQILFWDQDEAQRPVAWWSASRSNPGTAARLDIATARLIPAFLKVWISPDARHAITFVPAVDAPAEWSRYRLPEHFRYGSERRRSEPTSWDLLYKTRLALIDLTTGTARPLLNAPSGWAASRTPASIFWKGNKVIVSNTFLPLRANSNVEARAPGIAEVDIDTGEVVPIVADETHPAVEAIDWDATRQLLIIPEAGRREPRYLRRESKGWVETQAAARGALEPVLTRVESLNERPKLQAHGGRCSCSKILFDPAPQADDFRFVQAREIEFTDRNRITWKAALLLPHDYSPQRRYPLVVQTHGLRADEFLTDGPHGATTAMAAQPLASAGLAVLQVEDKSQAESSDEASNYAEGYRAAIQHMVDLGIADPDRIGITAFSRTGLSVIRLLADHPNLVAAATIADAGWWGYVQNLLMFNGPPGAAAQYWRATGGDRTLHTLSQVEAVDPLYRLAQGCTAIRIEANGPAAVLTNWEHFFLLARANRPVDLVYFPHGRHVLLKPAERLASQGGTLDWYRFWLRGDMDEDDEKQLQYARWRDLATRAAECKRNRDR